MNSLKVRAVLPAAGSDGARVSMARHSARASSTLIDAADQRVILRAMSLPFRQQTKLWCPD